MMKRISFFLVALASVFASCTREAPVDPHDVLYFTRFFVSAEFNEGVSEDFDCLIEGNVITAFCPALNDLSHVVVGFEGEFEDVAVNRELQFSLQNANDFNNPVKYVLSDSKGRERTYVVILRGGNNLPVISITTADGRPVSSKDEYAACRIVVDNDPENGSIDCTGQIKGRGNATWGYPKKPYKIKFDSKQSPCGFPADKKWVLLAEYCDKSLMRTAYMGSLSELIGLPFTIRYHHVELYMNGEYLGVYVLTDPVERDSKRVDIAADGFLVEHDNYWYNEPLYFTTSRKGYNYTFKYPDPSDGEIAKGDAEYQFINAFFNDFEAVLASEKFKDPDFGYRLYADERSFAKWYLLNELTGNMEPNMYYTLPSHNDKLLLSPGWDAEWSLGLAVWKRDFQEWGSYPMTSPVDLEFWSRHRYFARMFEDPYFVGVVKEEWEQLKPLLPDFQQEMILLAESLSYAQEDNFRKWHILDQRPGACLFALGSWKSEVEFVHNYFARRVDWFDTFIDSKIKK